MLVGAQRFLQSGSFGALLSKDYFGASLEGTWRPFCTLTYMLDAMVSFHPAVFKLDSLIGHIVAAWLLMALTRRLLPEGRRRWAIVAGLLFALHPITAETVDNASFREDSLVTAFTLATLILSLDRRRGLALFCYGLGLLSKESAVIAPALLAILRLGRFDREIPRAWGPPEPASPLPLSMTVRRLVVELIPFGVLTVIYLGIRFGPMKTPVAYAQYPGGTFGATLIGLPAIWAHDLRLLIWPWPLCADYTGYFRFGAQPWGPVLMAGAMVLGLPRAHRLRPPPGRAGGRARARLVSAGAAPGVEPAPDPHPGRRAVPLPAALWDRAGGGGQVRSIHGGSSAPARRRGTLLGVGLLAAFAVLLNLRHGDWHDDQRLWLATVAVNPRSCGAQSAVGGSLLSRGMVSGDPELLRASAAREELALRLCSDDSDPFRAAFAYTRLGAARALLDDRAAARLALERATVLHPRYALPFAWLGYLAYQEGDQAVAAMLLKKAIFDLGPPDATVAAVARYYVDKI